MGQFGRLTSLADLPADNILLACIRRAAQLKDAGIQAPPRTRANQRKERELVLPDCLSAALKKNKQARTNFDKFSYSHQKEYVEWLTSAKREETRQKRLATALTWIAQGKPQNWKYMSC